MRRRQFLGAVGGAAAAWSFAAHAQQSAKVPTIGFLGQLSPSAQNKWAAAFVQRLRELGWLEGRTVAIEYRWAEGRVERLAEVAAELVRLKVDVIVTGGTAAVVAAKRATSVIPIVFAGSSDPVGTGLVASLARPEGNVTGLSNQMLPSKRLELLREAVPGLRRLAIMANIGSPTGVLEMSEIKAGARTLGLEVASLEIRQAEEIAPAIAAPKGRADALYVVIEALVYTNRSQINTLALDARLPTMHGEKGLVEAGGLLSYGPSVLDLWQRAAVYVDKILRGAKPADLPVEQPTQFELVINLKIAKLLGHTIPPTLLARADEVIE
jgi:putative ABC transport system substrate-binding protein